MDNITAPAIGARIATDEIEGVHYPVSKLAHGGQDVATPVTADTPLPIADAAVLAAVQAVAEAIVAQAGGATEASLEALAALLPSSIGQKAQSNSLSIVPASGLNLATDGGSDFTQTVVTITAGMAAGTDPILAANVNRKAVQFGAAADFKAALASGGADGMRIYASARDGFTGKECPKGALYHVTGSGLAVGNSLVVWEA